MVARRVSVDGPCASVARAGSETRAGRAPDRRRARPSGAPQAPAARREARSVAAGDQGRRAAHAAPIGGRAIPLRERPRQVPCGTPDGRRERRAPPGTPIAPSEGSVDATTYGTRRGRRIDGASAGDGHVRRNRSGPEFNRGPGYRPSPVDVTNEGEIPFPRD